MNTDDDRDSIRRWARRQGFEVGDRGRLPSAVVDAFHHRDEKPDEVSMPQFTLIRAAVRRREEQIADALEERARSEPGARGILRRLAKDLRADTL